MRKGVLLAIGAYLIWGLFPLYWPLLEPAGAVEILAHRMFWSAVVMGIGITLVRRWRDVRALTARTWLLIGLAALFITVNWGVYIYAVNNGHVVDASLGYFINPLVAIALGVVALREKLAPLQWISLAVAVGGVILTSLGTHGFPYIAVTLAVSFGLYGLIKRIINIPAAISLLGESSVLMLPALGYLIWLQIDGSAHFIGYGAGHIAVMVGAGLVTAIPLLLFGAAARLIPLSVLGFLQYLNPLTVFLLGVFWAGEQMSPSRWAGFAVIWVSLALLSIEVVRRVRRRRRQLHATDMGQSTSGGLWMSLRDRLRSMRSGNDEYDEMPSGGGSQSAGPERARQHAAAAAGAPRALSGGTELTEFAPRQDGDYHCAASGLFLRFARPVVTETTASPTAAAPATGEFTTSGRFAVQRPFGRPIVYTVLGDDADGPAAHDEMLVVRRTDTGTRSTDRLEFVFAPDAQS